MERFQVRPTCLCRYCVFLAVSHYLCHFFACHHNSIDFYAKIGQGDQNSMTGFTGGLQPIYFISIDSIRKGDFTLNRFSDNWFFDNEYKSNIALIVKNSFY